MELFVRAKVSYSTLYSHDRIARQSDNTKTAHLEYTVDVSARSHKIASRLASKAMNQTPGIGSRGLGLGLSLSVGDATRGVVLPGKTSELYDNSTCPINRLHTDL